jgi:phage terminase large subunit-like protein
VAVADAPVWSTACPDWERRIVDGESLIPFSPLFPSEAEAGLEIFKELTAVDVAGSPKLGEISRQWILDFVSAIFGSYDPESGRRLIREFLLLISKKNGKSTNAAGIMGTALLLNWRQSGEMGILAPTVEVANNAYGPARDMIKADEELSDLLKVQDHIRTITHRATGATMQVVAADSDTVAGKKWIFTLVDELWLFGKRPNAAKMLLEATGGMASRPEGFVLYLTTQSDEPPAGVFKEKLDYARNVRDGKVVDPEFLPVLYEFPRHMIESKAYLDEANWHITNPNMGASVDIAYIRRKIKEAQEGSGGTLQDVLAKHLNVEIGLNLRSDRWAGADFWSQAEIVLTLDDLLHRCEVAVVGGDGGGLDDLLGQAVVGRERGTGKWLAWFHAWAHRIALERRKEIAPRLLDFQREGTLTIVDRPGQDVQEFADNVCRVRDAGLLPESKGIGVDAAGIGDIVDELAAREFEVEKDIVAISQGWRLTGAIKTTERKLAGGELLVAKSALMAWSVSNARIEQQKNAVTINKQVSGTAKIDPVMALFDAVSLMALNPQGQSTPGLTVLEL